MTAVSNQIIATWREGNCQNCNAEVKGSCLRVSFHQTGGSRTGAFHFCSTRCLTDVQRLIPYLHMTRQYFCPKHGSGGTLLAHYSEKMKRPLVDVIMDQSTYSAIKSAFESRFPGAVFQNE